MSIEKLGLFATRLGVPLPDLLDAARLLLKKNCLRCEIYSQILRRIHQIGPKKAEYLIKELIKAKKENNLLKMAAIQRDYLKN